MIINWLINTIINWLINIIINWISDSWCNYEWGKLNLQVEDILRVRNESNSDSSFIIRIDQLLETDSMFTIEWDERGEKVELLATSALVCTLKPNAETHLRVKFEPKDQQGDFSVEAPIFVRGQLEGRRFNSLKLQGKNPKCRFESDVREIYLCPVPLKVKKSCQHFLWHWCEILISSQ